jgi:translation initiation factor 1
LIENLKSHQSKMVKKSKKVTGSIVYSTNPDFSIGHQNESVEHTETLPPGEQNLRVWLDRKKRKGKVVTLVQGFIGTDEDLKELAKLLKTKCGVGGTAKDAEIVIQGEVREKVLEILIQQGYKAKKAGG